MSSINRGLVVVKPKQPLLEWLRKINAADKNDDLAELQFDSTGYLVPEYEDDNEQREILKEFHASIFELELESWTPEESTWPKQRDLKMFLEWFEVEFHSVVHDLAEGLPMQDVAYGNDPDDYDEDEFD
jgi:hypothetical protein